MKEKYNIMCLGNQNIPHASEQTVSRDLVRQGHNIIPFVYPSLGITDYSEINNILNRRIELENPDFILCHKCPGLSNKVITNMKSKFKIPIVSWNFDLFRGYLPDFPQENHLYLKRLQIFEEQIDAFDVVFGAEAGEESIEMYRDNDGANYYPLKLGADPEWFKKTAYDSNFEKHRCDISFLGGVYNGLRKKMRSKLLSIPNTSYKQFTGYKVLGVEQPNLFMNDISKFANVCKISIGCNFRNDIEGYWSKRCYELMGANMFMIQAHVKGMEKEGFKNKKNTIFYHNNDFEEMEELIKYYLENEEERNKIKDEGYKLIHKYHMQKNRTKEFFKILKKDGVV